MSQATPHLIANPRIGLERDIEPFLLPEDAFPDMQDCYEWRGRIKRRKGYQFLGRLNRQIGTTNGDGSFGPFTLINAPLLGAVSQFQVGTASPLFYQDPDPDITVPHDTATLKTTAAGGSTLVRSTGVLTITANAPTGTLPIFYYPGLPVMGLATLDNPSFLGENNESLVAFDTRFAYLAVNPAPGFPVFQDLSFYKTSGTFFNWTGSDAQFFWTTNYANAMWATNNKAGFQSVSTATTPGQGDGIRWLDQDKSGWVNFCPPVTGAVPSTGVNPGTGTSYLLGALIILPYKDRLVCLNTQEGTNPTAPIQFSQRARWSQNGTPFNKNDPSGALAPKPTNYPGGQDSNNTAWSNDVTGKGGFIDAPTLEQIISADFVYDSLIVYFERSTWQLRYTGNELLPFVWEKINTELGAQSTFSIIPLDHKAIAFGNVGLHSCDSVNVDRIDQRIPDEVFNIQNVNQGPQRVYGVRDYFNQLLYWTLPYIGLNSEEDYQTDGQTIIYPNKVLVYNYIDKTYSFYNDSFTCFGYYQSPTGLTWGAANIKWGDADFPWVSAEKQAIFQSVVGGNQQGFVEVIAQQSNNDESLIISDITTTGTTTTIISPNHNLQDGDFIKILSASGITGLTNVIFKVETTPTVDKITINVATPGSFGTFTGNGLMTVVNNYSLLSKKFNLSLAEAAQTRLMYTDFYFDRDDNGQVQVNLLINESQIDPVNRDPTVPPPISSVSSAITNITSLGTTPPTTEITVTDGTQFSVGNTVYITNVFATTLIGMIQINNLGLVVTKVVGNVVTVDLDSSTFTAYVSGGVLWNMSRNTGNFVNLFPESTYSFSPDVSFVNKKLWKRIYFNSISQLFQLQITLDENQMKAEPIAECDITLHALILWTAKAGRLINI